MKIELTTKELQSMVKGRSPYYDEFNHPLVKKAGHSYCEPYGSTSWSNLDNLTDEELYELYLINKNSWKR